MTRIKLFVLVASVTAARVTAVVTSNSIEMANRISEYGLIMKWVTTLINLLCSERIHQNGGGADNFDLILDTVSFLLDGMCIFFHYHLMNIYYYIHFYINYFLYLY